MSLKKTIFINDNLLKDSSDSFRNFVGGYYENIDIEASGEQRLKFTDRFTSPKLNGNTAHVYYGIPNSYNPLIYSYNGVEVDYSKIMPSYKFPVRIVASISSIENDEHWRATVVGGTYADETYEPLISPGTHEYFKLSYDVPYGKQETLELLDTAVYDTIEITCDYDQYILRYQDKTTSFESDLYLPNYYILSDYYSKRQPNMEDINKTYSSEMLEWISLENQYKRPEDLLSFNRKNIPYSVPRSYIDTFTDIRKKNTNLTVEYLPSSIYNMPTGSSVKDWVTTKQKNIFVDNRARINLKSLKDLQNCLPYKIKIKFPAQSSGMISNQAVASKFDSKMLSALSDAFVQQNSVSISDTALLKEQARYTNSDGIQSLQFSVDNNNFKQIDYLELLTYARNNYNNQNPDCMFIGENNLERLSALDDTGVYRHINTLLSTRALEVVSEMTDKTDLKINNIDDLYSRKNSYQETLAYRIEKIAGPPAGDGRTQNTLQNYWFTNSKDFDRLEFFDSQVKYGTDYTYKIYAYVLVGGYKYEYSDVRITRNIKCSDAGGYSNGLEFYDPVTDEATDELYKGMTSTTSTSGVGSGSVILTNDDYMADFNISYEPYLRIIEIPLHEKTLKILDNPPNKINITPFQVLDNSQKIGFITRYDNFSNDVFSKHISSEDEKMAQDYLHAYNMLEQDKIKVSSRSKQSIIEVYRLDRRPNSLQEFDGNLYKTIGLSYEDSSLIFKRDEIFYDRISVNTKYYYLFRALNQQGIPGRVSEIYEVELINDGGYKFALFNVILESELEQPPPKTNSKSCKKIFQLKPNISQISLNTENVDFSQSAASQLSNVTIGTAEDLIWDKTFKIRLTSKKTSKKIDLNITYKISSE